MMKVLIILTLFVILGCSSIEKKDINKSNIELNASTAKDNTLIPSSSGQDVVSEKKEIKTITDIKSWDHPTKKILETIGTLEKIEFKNAAYPIFYVDAIQIPNYSFFLDLAEANDFWDYTVINTDKIHGNSYEVSFDKVKKRITNISHYEGYDLVSSKIALTKDDFTLFYNGAFHDFDPNVVFNVEGRLVSIKTQYKGESYWNYNIGDIQGIVTGGRVGEIIHLNINQTKRGLKVGDNSKKIEQIFGEANILISQHFDFDNSIAYVYNFDNKKQLVFYIKDEKIESIEINLSNEYNDLIR